MDAQNYEYKIINLQARNKELYSSIWTLKLTTRAGLVMDKLAKDGWELTNTTHNAFGFPMVLTFRKVVTH
jgi:hypothetical protein